MGDRRRFEIFARFVANQVPVRKRSCVRVADVAAGSGMLVDALREQGFREIVAFDPRLKKCGRVHAQKVTKLFTADMAKDFDLLVGMHPDDATDVILDAATKTDARAIVAPCCVIPTAWRFTTNDGSQRSWLEHLKRESFRRGLRLSETILPMTGANTVLWS